MPHKKLNEVIPIKVKKNGNILLNMESSNHKNKNTSLKILTKDKAKSKELDEQLPRKDEKTALPDESDFDIYDGLDDAIVDDATSYDELNWGMDFGSENNVLEDDDDDQQFYLKMSPSPRSMKSCNTDDCNLSDAEGERKINGSSTVDSFENEKLCANKNADKSDKDLDSKCNINNTQSLKSDKSKGELIPCEDNEKKCENIKKAKNTQKKNEIKSFDDSVKNDNEVEVAVLEDVISSIESQDRNLENDSSNSTKCLKRNNNTSIEDSPITKKMKLIHGISSKEDSKVKNDDFPKNKESAGDTINRNFFEFMTESKINLEKNESLKSKDSDEENKTCLPPNSNSIKKEVPSHKPAGKLEKKKQCKKETIRMNAAALESLIIDRVRKMVSEEVECKHKELMKRCSDLEVCLSKEKKRSQELQREVTQLNISLSKAAAEIQNMNAKKVPQRTVGVQIRFSSEKSLAKPDGGPVIANKNQNFISRKIMQASDHLKNGVPSILPQNVFPTIPNKTLVSDKNLAVTSSSAVTTKCPNSEMNLSMRKLEVQPLLNQNPPKSSNIPPIKVDKPSNSISQNNAIKPLLSETSIVNIIDLTADDEEGKTTMKKGVPVKNLSNKPTILMPSTKFAISPTTSNAPVNMQPAQVVQNTSTKFSLAPQAGVNLPSGQQLVLVPNTINRQNSIMVKTNNIIPGQPSTPNMTPTTSVVVSTVRLPNSVEERIAAMPGMKIITTNNQPKPVVVANKPLPESSSSPNLQEDGNAESKVISLNNQKNRHPAPLPRFNNFRANVSIKALKPPQPVLKTSRVQNGIVLSWSMELTSSHSTISSYMLYAYQESSAIPNISMWKKVGDVKALPLPMACTLTQFMDGHKYHFAVCALDVHNRVGPFSLPGSIMLSPKTSS